MRAISVTWHLKCRVWHTITSSLQCRQSFKRANPKTLPKKWNSLSKSLICPLSSQHEDVNWAFETYCIICRQHEHSLLSFTTFSAATTMSSPDQDAPFLSFKSWCDHINKLPVVECPAGTGLPEQARKKPAVVPLKMGFWFPALHASSSSPSFVKLKTSSGDHLNYQMSRTLTFVILKMLS